MTVEKNVLLQKEQNLIYPITKTENVLDLEDYMIGYKYYRHYSFINQVYDLNQYTFETTFLDIIKSMKERSILRYETTESNVPNVNYLCTNELFSITGSYYNLVEIIRHTTASETIKIYNRDASNYTWKGMFIASARSKDNLISGFSFIGKTAWEDLVLQNDWKKINNFEPQYRRENDRIFFRGRVANETYAYSNRSIANLPSIYAPSKQILCSTIGALDETSPEVMFRIDIATDGKISINDGNRNKYTVIKWISLDGVSFPIKE